MRANTAVAFHACPLKIKAELAKKISEIGYSFVNPPTALNTIK
jgi:hypothetical protein